jgi:signal transduction histidine kinase
MEDVEGDLMLVLGSWRERMAAQLRAHDITLSWQVMKPEGLPIFPDLRPWHVIQIVRLLDEAVTNAIKHSGARTLKVVIDTIADDAAVTGGSIVIEDDGNGFDAKSTPADAGHRLGTGRGLVNMRKRAEFCGATLDIVSGATGTRIDLWLPISIGAVASTDGRPG